MANTSSIDLAKTSEVAEHKIGTVATVGNTDYIYLKNRSSATEQGAVFAYDPLTYTWENWATNTNLTGLVRPLAVFNANRNASNFVASTKDIRNLVLQSQVFNNAAWEIYSSGLTISGNNAVAPDGTTTAETVTVAATTDTHRMGGTGGTNRPVATAGISYRLSLYAKQGTHRYIIFGDTADAAIRAVTVDLQTCAVTVNTNIPKVDVLNVGNGWCRILIEYTRTNTGNISPDIYAAQNAAGTTSSSWTGAGTETFFIWGAQANLVSDSTDYVATTSAHYHDVPSAISVPANHYAWAAVRGEIQVTVFGSCVKNVPLYTSASSGYLDDSSSSQTLIQGAFIENTNNSISVTRLMSAYAVQPMRS
jgi:hypothetical protein